eukprot:TRINITY_DN66564_c13_g5_i1.p1 TRINITY_DN66564_c13_g5~~TRINITY_DN66564_c13_g5_i1.p1  ORF type:complete len:339 (-),score=140.45 TRINITY_DN66564_c13_g5_i1:43-1059(-)
MRAILRQSTPTLRRRLRLLRPSHVTLARSHVTLLRRSHVTRRAPLSSSPSPRLVTLAKSMMSTETHEQQQQQQQQQKQHEQQEEVEREEEEELELREAVLRKSLELVGAHGWTEATIDKAVAELGLSPASAGVLQRGPVEVVEYFIRDCNDRLSAKLRDSADIMRNMRTVDKLKTAIRIRLDMQSKYAHNWHQAMALGALPQNAGHTLHNIAEMVDEIWHVSGDRSADMNWYTKRALLAGVYAATELYMLTDKSDGFESTWRFLDRRMEDINHVAALPSQLQALVGTGVDFLARTVPGFGGFPFGGASDPFAANEKEKEEEQEPQKEQQKESEDGKSD